jgi:hypothetical protein
MLRVLGELCVGFQLTDNDPLVESRRSHFTAIAYTLDTVVT